MLVFQKFWSKAKKLSGDTGAREFLRDSATPVSRVPMPEAIFDIDTQKDVENLKNRPPPT